MLLLKIHADAFIKNEVGTGAAAGRAAEEAGRVAVAEAVAAGGLEAIRKKSRINRIP
jgi:hypothetical protein